MHPPPPPPFSLIFPFLSQALSFIKPSLQSHTSLIQGEELEPGCNRMFVALCRDLGCQNLFSLSYSINQSNKKTKLKLEPVKRDCKHNFKGNFVESNRFKTIPLKMVKNIIALICKFRAFLMLVFL